MAQRHKVFVSFHHGNDAGYKERFEQICDGYIISGSVDDGDIDTSLPTGTIRQRIRDKYLRDTSVTVVLIGRETWKRKHVDWEIGSSLRNTKLNPRSGLIGIILPSYPRPSPGHYDHCTIPPRLWDNVECEYAGVYGWTEDPEVLADLIHEAYKRKSKVLPDNSRDQFGRNRTTDRWC
jgi:hypothetical protein